MNGFFAMMNRMKYIDRWALMRNTERENLSEHTLDVAMLTYALINIANSRLGENLCAEKGAVMAMFHDAPEIITGDLPTPVKYHDSEIKGAYDKIESQAISRLLSMLPEDLRPIYAQNFEEDIEYTPYVKAADKLSALIKCIEEGKSGNEEFKKAEEQTLAHPALKLPAAAIFISEFLPSYRLTLDEL